MATISVRLDDSIRDQAEDLAAGEGLSLSEWVRRLIAAELGLAVPDWSAPSSLSKRDRHQLALLHRVIELLAEDDHEAAYHAQMIEVLESGFTGGYGDEFASTFDEVPIGDCRLVWDILDMFRVLEASIKEIGTQTVHSLDEHAAYALRFQGFDFNDQREGRLADYAAHMIRRGRWSDLAPYFDDEHESGNSHREMLDTYERMLAVFTPIWRGRLHGHDRGRGLLSEADLLQISRAVYPQRRGSA